MRHALRQRSRVSLYGQNIGRSCAILSPDMMLRVPLACFPGGVIFGLSPYAIRQNPPELKAKSIFSAQFCIFVRPIVQFWSIDLASFAQF